MIFRKIDESNTMWKSLYNRDFGCNTLSAKVITNGLALGFVGLAIALLVLGQQGLLGHGVSHFMNGTVPHVWNHKIVPFFQSIGHGIKAHKGITYPVFIGTALLISGLGIGFCHREIGSGLNKAATLTTRCFRKRPLMYAAPN